MLIVVTIVGVMAAISYPAFSSGVDSLRLSGAADSVAAALNVAVTRAERRQDAVEIVIEPLRRTVRVISAEPGFFREVVLPDGVSIVGILPPVQLAEEGAARRFVVYPGGTAPAIGVVLGNRHGARRIVRVDPISGVPRIERGRGQQNPS
jgi:hypothetical protein